MLLIDQSCHNRYLHSFPTRRSSDLGGASTTTSPVPTTAFPFKLPAPPGPGGTQALADRKSTRLNSSHRCISYAVFCLKKKKYRGPAEEQKDQNRSNAHGGKMLLDPV